MLCEQRRAALQGCPRGWLWCPARLGTTSTVISEGAVDLCSDRQLAGDLVEPWQATSLVLTGSQ